ncbi:hypothetical protein IIA28_04995 [candidate division KSB1 bacterium]|nr:hypothetical protein [candidate division KSB1 bacterium]
MFFSPPGKCAMQAAEIDIREILNHKESLFWQHFNDQRSNRINQEVDYKVILKDALGRISQHQNRTYSYPSQQKINYLEK